MRGQYGRAEESYYKEGKGLSITSMRLSDRYAKPEYKGSLPYEPTFTKYSTSYYSKPITSALSSYPKQAFDYKYSTPFKNPASQSFNTEYKSSYTPYKNSAFTKSIVDNTQCLTNREKGQQPTDLGRKVPLKQSKEIPLTSYEPSSYSMSGNGVVEGYASNSNKGLVR
jgi:hypothetical protein